MVGWLRFVGKRRPCGGQRLLEVLPRDLELGWVQYLSLEELVILMKVSKDVKNLVLLVCEGMVRDMVEDFESPLIEINVVKQFCGNTDKLYEKLPHLAYLLLRYRQGLLNNTVACGEGHTLVVEGSKTVFAFGDGERGQLGTRKMENSVVPERTTILWDFEVDSVACGSYHSAILTKEGRIITFGENNAGQLGDGTTTSRAIPKYTKECFSKKTKKPLRFTQVVCGLHYTAALTTCGRVALFGSGLDCLRENGSVLLTPFTKEGEICKQLAGGDTHLLILTNKNNVYALGNGSYGKLGLVSTLNKMTRLKQHPHFPMMSQNEKKIALALITNESVRVPQLVAFSESEPILQIAAGGSHSAILTTFGHVYMWGSCKSGQLGLGKFTESVPIPSLVNLPTSAMQISCGKAHTGIVLLNGKVVTFGGGEYRQDGKQTKFWATVAPQAISQGDLINEAVGARSIQCGGRHSVAIGFGKRNSCYTFGDPFCGGRMLRKISKPNYLPKKLNIQTRLYGRRLNSV